MNVQITYCFLTNKRLYGKLIAVQIHVYEFTRYDKSNSSL